ncbi:MAG: ABC transporter substrate-binding protein, partial [Candidatus Ornithospirochaeta sp.]
MKKLSLFLIVVLLLCSCSKKTGPKEGIVVQDDLGRSVTVGETERTASLVGSLAQIWMLSGGTVVAAPDDAWEDLDLDLPEDAVNLGKINNLSMEKLLASEPDWIIASPNVRQDVSWKETLEAGGIPTAYFEVYTFSDYLHVLDVCTDITGRKDLFKKYGT